MADVKVVQDHVVRGLVTPPYISVFLIAVGP